MGAIVLNGARVGTGSLIAAGAVVLGGEVIPPGSLVAGVPARVRREISEAERADIEATAAEYVALARRHRDAVPDGTRRVPEAGQPHGDAAAMGERRERT